MKRIMIMLLAMLLIGCVGNTNDAIELPPETTGMELTETVALPTADPKPPEKTAEPTFTPEQVRYTISPDQVVPYAPDATQGTIGTTLIRQAQMKGALVYSFRDVALDWTDLQLAVLAFDPDSEMEALKLRVTLPESVDETLLKDLIETNLHYRFEIDGRQVDAFRDRIVKQISSHVYEVAYRRCILHPICGKTLSIRPFLLRVQSAAVWDSGEKNVDLIEVGSMSVEQKNLYGMRHTREYLDRSAVIIQTDLPEAERESILYPVTIEEVDWEASNQKGCYGEGNTPSETADLFLREKDFSDASFSLESLIIRDDLVFASFTWRFPNSFTDEECRNLCREHLKFCAYYDDDCPETAKDIRSKKDAPFSGRKTFWASTDPYESVRYENHSTLDCRELHIMVVGSTQSMAQWKTHRTLTIVPYYWYYTDVNYQTAGGKRVDGKLSEEGIRVERDWTVGEMDFRTLDALAITVELTPELYANGY